MDTLISRIENTAERGRGRVVFINGDEHDPVSWTDLHRQARAMAAGIQRRGVEPGDHVALIGPTTRSLVAATQAIWLSGAASVMMPLPMRLASIEQFVEQTRARVEGSDARLVVIDADLAPFLEARPGDPEIVVLDDLVNEAAVSGDADYTRPDDDPDRLIVLQFTSGSTSEPKGVTVPDRCCVANLDAIREATGYDPDVDVMVSWLPLYHDMGLVGMLMLPMSGGNDLVLGAPQDFLSRPARWMQWISEYGGTATAGPNFSYVLATRALKRGPELDLSNLRIALNGAEPVDPSTVEKWIEAGERHGLRPGAAFPAFGMAETTIAGTFPEPMRGLTTDTIDGTVLEAERYAAPTDPSNDSARQLVRLGRPVQGLEIRIVDTESGRSLADREVGELQIKGTSVTPGYYKRDDVNAESFDDGWLKTGDLAYTVEGELVMCGRIKDVIIVGGRNVYPQDIEKVAGEVEGIRAGNVIAFGVEGRAGKQDVIVVAETKNDDLELLVKKIGEQVQASAGLPPKEVVLVEAGTLPKTSSGKLQRTLCRERFENGELDLRVGLA